MTLKELKNYPYVINAIKRYERELAELYDDSAGSMSPDMSGMPHGSGRGSKVESGYLRNAERIEELTAKIKDYYARLHKYEQFFDSIDDVQTLQIFELRFKKQFTWEQIAACIGGNNSTDSLKKICYRYLERYNQK